MMNRLRGALSLIWQTIYKFFGDGCPGMAAALSFYTFFSLPALLSLVLMLVGLFADPHAVESAITTQVGSLIGTAGAQQVATIIQHARPGGTSVSLTTFLSLLAVAFGATTAFAQLQSALNRTWSVEPDPKRNQIRTFLVKRIFSFGVVLALIFLLLVSLAVTTALTAFGGLVTRWLGVPDLLIRVVSDLISFVIIAALFGVMYKFLPDAQIGWKTVTAGAIGTALLFVLGKAVIGAYLGGTDPGSAYGAAGSLALVLIWVYYSSMIVLFGAEFTRVWAERFGEGVVPEEGAVRVVQETRRVGEG